MNEARLMLTYKNEMDFACLYAIRRPIVAREAAAEALYAAQLLGRPDLAWNANAILAVI